MATRTRERAGEAQRAPSTVTLRWLSSRLRRRVLPSQPFALLALTGLTVLVCLLAAALEEVPLVSLVLVTMVGGFFLRLRALVLLFAVIAAGALYVVADGEEDATPGVVTVLVATAAIVMLYARSRERLGVQGTVGDSMFVDLRDRLEAQGEIPALPPRWHAEKVIRSAFGDGFSGDFLVASRSGDGGQLELVLVDVSGKGQAAGTRALLLSGAFGGLLGALGREAFLPAANAYLLRQHWEEGFATAAHLAVDLCTGEYRLASAGHPPAVHYRAGSGRWELLEESSGPALGIVEVGDFPAHTARLEAGDALLLYTDGLVEIPGEDLGLGIDRLVGQAAKLQGTFDRRPGDRRTAAEEIVHGTRASDTDDRGLVLLWRDA